MGLKWLSRKSNANPSTKQEKKSSRELSLPVSYLCPISLELMKDPVTVSTGITYDRENIEKWLETGHTTCPVTKEELKNVDTVPNHALRTIIQDWCVANRAFGVDQIPTPKVPVTQLQAIEILSGIARASGSREEVAKHELLVSKFKMLVKESEKNKRCFVSNKASTVLSASFSAFANEGSSRHFSILKDILSALSLVLPLDKEARRSIGSTESLNSLSSVLKDGDRPAKMNALLVLNELLSLSQGHVLNVSQTEELIDTLFGLIKDRIRISPQIAKASLIVIFYLVSTDENSATKCVELGMIPVLLDTLTELEKSSSEKALAVLDALMSCEKARLTARNNALSIPALVKKMLRVSDIATEFSVSILLKLCKDSKGEEDEECLVEALQFGAFQKLLLLLQIGCAETTKERATELLKLLNEFRGRAECTETMDFKGLKRAF